MSVALGFLLMTDLGLSPRLIREASARPDMATRLYREALGLKLLLMPLGLVAVGIAALLLPYPAEVRQLLVLTGVAALLQSLAQANEAFLRSQEVMHWEALANLGQSILTTGLAIGFLAGGLTLVWVGVARVVGAAGGLLLTSVVLRREIRPRLPSASGWKELRDALPYAATASMNLAYGQVDILLMSLIAPQALVGEYALVSRIVLVAGTFASTGAAALLPIMARTFTSAARSVFRSRAWRLLLLALVIGGLGTGLLAMSGGTILTLAYGPDFEGLRRPFAFASGYVLLRFVTAALGMELTAAGLQSARARCILLGLAATVVLVVGGVPIWGVAGAIAALVGSELVLAGSLIFAARSFLGAPDPTAAAPQA